MKSTGIQSAGVAEHYRRQRNQIWEHDGWWMANGRGVNFKVKEMATHAGISLHGLIGIET